MSTFLPVIDLHCDLLSYLANVGSSVENPEVRCSLPQLKKGGVRLQTLALFTRTRTNSTQVFQRQVNKALSLKESEIACLPSFSLPDLKEKLFALFAIENASGLIEEEESLQVAFQRFDAYQEQLGSPFLYVSLTWNDENRFGGGNATQIGLKRDGELFLEFLEGKAAAIDLSHTSDHLAEGILNHIDKKGLTLIPIASHSNFRTVTAHMRNLPDEFATEIIKRGGVIGLNFVRKFVGEDFISSILSHIKQAILLNGLDHLCLGADFFFDKDPSAAASLAHLAPLFDPLFSDASIYPLFFSHLTSFLSFPQLEGIAWRNSAACFERLIHRQKLKGCML